jgi:PHD/YefM family antitoxin component YafN of YafNO toxin-antitoxin module
MQACQLELGLTTVMSSESSVQYVADANGKAVAVLVPIEIWREIESERETADLLKSEAMRNRLLEAKERIGGISLDDARKKLGI